MKYYIKIALQHLAMGLMIPVAIVWKTQNGLSIPQAIMTESLVLLVTALADLPAGFIANHINNKRSLLLGGLLHFASMILLATGGSLVVFIIAATLMGLAWAFVSGADEAYLHDDFIVEKALYRKHFSTVSIVDETATVLGMVATTVLLLLSVDMRWLFIVSSVLLGIHFFYTWFFLPPSKLPETSSTAAGKIFTITLIKNKALLALLPLMAAFAVIYEAVRPLWQPHMQQLGINVASFGVLFAIFKLASVGGSLVSRSREFIPRDLGIVFSLMLAALLAFSLNNKILAIAALCLYLFTENYFRIFMSTVLNKVVTSNRAAVLSLGSVIRNSTGAAIIAGAGWLSVRSMMLAFGVVVLLKLPAVLFVIRTYRAAK